MTISVQLYSVRENFAADAGEVLRRLSTIGFTKVEPYGVVENLATLRTGLPDNGLTAPTAHARLIGADQHEVFAAAAELGIGLVIDPMVRAEHWQTASDIAATADALNAAAKIGAEHGVRVGYHNHWWELESKIDGRVGFEVLADSLDPDVDLEVDTYWATAGGANAPELLKKLGARVKALHIKDGGLNTDASGQVPAGQGQVPVTEVLAAAPDALRVIEFDAYDGDIYAGIEASYQFVSGEAR